MQQKRSVYLDLLRILAMFGVLLIHTTQIGAGAYLHEAVQGSFPMIIRTICLEAAFFAIPLFFMISGAFLLDPKRDESAKKLLTKKIPPLLTALVFWSVIYALYALGMQLRTGTAFSPHLLKEFVIAVIEGKNILWFIPAIIGMYLITPVLRLITAHASKKMFLYIFLLYLAVTTVHFSAEMLVRVFDAPDVTRTLAYKFPLELVVGWTPLFLLGYYLKEFETERKYRQWIYCGAAALFAAQIALSVFASVRLGEPFDYVAYSTLPSTSFVCVALFLFFKYSVSQISFSEKAQRVIAKVSSLTFGIYLVHLLVLLVTHDAQWVDASLLPGTPYTLPFFTVGVFLVSLGLSWAISKIPVVGRYLV